MVAQLLDDGLRLLFDFSEKGLILGIDAAGEHEILPDQNPLAITELIKGLRLVDAAAPHTQRVDIRFYGFAQQLFISCVADPGIDRIARRPIHAFEKNRFAVHLEIKAAFVSFQRLLNQFDRAHAKDAFAAIDLPMIFGQSDGIGQQGRRTMVVRPPQRRILQSKRFRPMVHCSVEG
ncbi:MAG: hypothetical protein BWY83_01280 [bacterium ADurb.Bin478]|nr:MAG: hypothetical protein BWY83_01280 [bacterium ADurb.Bin478]